MIRIGFDVGGSKLAAIALDPAGNELARLRSPVPRSYDATLATLLELTRALEQTHGRVASVGIGMPGVIDAAGMPLRVANLPWLEGRPLGREVAARLECPVRVANDANCFALSEATDGAAAGAACVFGAILGTGIGGGIVLEGRLVTGAQGIAGEWGHSPLAFEREPPWPPQACGCGRIGCAETWLNGAALARDFLKASDRHAPADEVGRLAAAGDPAALAATLAYATRLARALAAVINLLDPTVIVLGGGLSEIPLLYQRVPELWRAWVVAPEPATRLVRARFGPDSGLRGAAWLGAATA